MATAKGAVPNGLRHRPRDVEGVDGGGVGDEEAADDLAHDGLPDTAEIDASLFMPFVYYAKETSFLASIISAEAMNFADEKRLFISSDIRP